MAFEIPTDLHTDLAGSAWLLGTWHGNGRGDYPTIDPFAYEQEVVFAHDGRPFLHYFSRTWITDDDGNAHPPWGLETGFLRVGSEDGSVELVLGSPHRVRRNLVRRGSTAPRITLTTDVVARTVTAKEYTAGQRMYGLVEGDLMYAFDMAAQGQEMQSHLWGRLQRA